MRRIFVTSIFLTPILMAGSVCQATAAEPLETLLADYKSYGLPLPPKDAELAILPSPAVSFGSDGRHQDMHVVLLVRKATANSKAVYWVGCEEGGQWQGIEFRPAKPAKASLENTAPLPVDHRGLGFPTYPDLALAIQCHALGWHELAASLLERSKQPPEHDSFKRRPPRPKDDRAALAELAWNYHCDQFVRSKADRPATVAQMKKLLTTAPGIDTKAHRNLVEDMEKTVADVKTTPGSLEAAIEGLVDFRQDWGSFLGSGWRDQRNNAHEDPNYRKLQEAGLLAVPILIQHVGDFRLTRRVQTNQHGSYTWHIRVADLVAQLLNGIAGEQFAYDFLEREGRGVRADRAQVEDWWKKTGGTKELDYLLKNLESKDEDGRKEGNAATLKALGARYPAELVKVFAERQKTGKLDYQWFEALAASKASDEDKARLFLAAAKSDDEWQQIHALRALAGMKHSETGKLIIAVLERQPRTPKEEYWQANLGNFAQIAYGVDDDKVWETLLKTAKRADVGQRLEMLNAFSRFGRAPLQERAVRFLEVFLVDTEVRDRESSKLFDGPGAAFIFKRIAVRDFAAEQLAHQLRLNVHSDPTWKDADWKALRERVQEELTKRAKR